MAEQQEPHLKVYSDRSVLVSQDGVQEIFKEGRPNEEAQNRLSTIEQAFNEGYLPNLINSLQEQKTDSVVLDIEHLTLLEKLVESTTSEIGRALIGLSVLVLSIKDISPEQSVRLHKGGRGDFSWEDGLSMRNLDRKYITPALRQHGLLRFNRDGIFTTRSLAENYPYSKFYKAAIRGAKEECFTLIDWIEAGYVQPRPMLEVLISILINRSEQFINLGNQTLNAVNVLLETSHQPSEIRGIVKSHVANSTYSARLLEVAMHSLLQALNSHTRLSGKLEILSQMRSANKKRGNVGDIEIVSEDPEEPYVIEAWDAKYGKPYLRDELEELNDKLEMHPETVEAGFVVDRDPIIDADILHRIEELNFLHDIDIKILTFDEWVDYQLNRYGIQESSIMDDYLRAYAESLALRRQEIAPIDEPADQWLQDLLRLLTE